MFTHLYKSVGQSVGHEDIDPSSSLTNSVTLIWSITILIIFWPVTISQPHMIRQNPFLAKFKPQNSSLDDLISVLEARGTNCPDKSIPNAKERHHEASPDILKGSRLIWMSASTNREERNDAGGDGGEDRGGEISRAEWKPCRRLMSRKIMF